ncbi:DUF1642 domain-containing protein [Streptococcus uberis]|uniref:DUF1642 domain-containing protein n=1 Tax=Streptococcus uberis TaxID=1349 RepID=UPI0027DD52D2|nr:DUF1642 domain-containing protein [Streptococcus uberis]MCK1239869.1 DUF1642 domain-containing protein [Streptococcus uberis]
MNIEEKEKLKEEVKNVAYNSGTFFNIYEVSLSKVLKIIDKFELDQPKLKVPQCVFDMIKEYKEEGNSLYVAIYDADCFEKVQYWIDSQENGYDQFARAWIAYPNIAVEKEKLYTVEIPDPNSKDTVYYLFKNEDGQVEIGSVLFLETEPDDSWRDDPDMQLTEQEIKKRF